MEAQEVISLNINDTIIKKHKEYMKNSYNEERIENLKTEICEKQSESKKKDQVGEFFEWIQEQYKLLDGDDYKKSIFLCLPDKIKDVSISIKEKYNWIFVDYWKAIVELLGYDTFSKRGMIEKRRMPSETINLENYNKIEGDVKWSAYSFVMEMNLKVCPYCNRNFITPLYDTEAKTRGDLDHFLPKEKYPFLAMSIYNLVPCCKVCNSSLKSTNEFSYEKNLSPYEERDIENMYTFTYKPKSYKDFYSPIDEYLEIDILYNNEEEQLVERMKNNMKIFKIKELYSYHSDLVRKMIIRKSIYPKEYVKVLAANYERLFEGEYDDIDKIVFDKPDDNEIKNTVLGKLKYDIWRELSEV